MMSKFGIVMKKVFLDKIGSQSVEKWTFQKLGLALGLGLELGLAFQGVKMSTFDGPDDVQIWESDEKGVLDKIGAQSVKKVDFFI